MRHLTERAAIAALRLTNAVQARASHWLALRLTGIAVAIGGLALMAFGTIGSPLSAGALAFESGNQSITSISEECSQGVTSGTLDVSGAVTGNTVTLEVFAHNPSDGLWHATGATTVVTMAAGTSSYSYTISGVPASFSDGTVSGDSGNDAADPDAAGDDFNSWRVQVATVSGTFDGTTTKSDSFGCSAATTTTTSSTTSTSTSSTTSTSTSSTTSTSTSSTTSTSTSTSSSTSTTSSTPSTSSTSSTSSTTATAPGSSTSTTTTSSTGTAPASTTASTSTASTTAGVEAVSTPGTGAGSDAEFGLGLGLLIAGGGLAAGAARFGRRPKK